MKQAEGLRAEIVAQVGRLSLEIEIDTGDGTLIVAGPNGAGKSSLLSLLLGVLPVSRGKIRVGETLLLDTTRGVDVPIERRSLGFVPQTYALFPHLTVRENIGFAWTTSSARHDRSQQETRTEKLLEDLDLRRVADRRPGTLSGGEKQRVALARALSVQPRALLLDEPLAALDVDGRRDVRAFLVEYLARLRLPTVIITHDAEDARVLGRRIVVVEDGRVTQRGSSQELFAAPASAFVRRWLAG